MIAIGQLPVDALGMYQKDQTNKKLMNLDIENVKGGMIAIGALPVDALAMYQNQKALMNLDIENVKGGMIAIG